MDIPEPALIFLVGAAGSGKTTWANARYLPEEVVSSDRLRAVVGSGEADLDASAEAFELLRAITFARIRRRLTVVVDTVGLDDHLRSECLERARAAGLETALVVFTTPEEVCRARNRQRARPVPAKVLSSQLSRVKALSESVAHEGWAHVVAIDGSSDLSAATVDTSGHPHPRPGSETGVSFILHVSRFAWDEPLGVQLAAVAIAAEEAGFEGISVMDHLVQIPQVGRAWEDIPEPFTALSFLAGVTEHLELGTLVLNVTLRNLGLLAKSVASLDVLAGGRVFCGIGAGWNVPEERAYGYPAITTRERLDRLEDAARLLPQMWGKGTVTFEGSTTTVTDAMTYPRPIRERVPLLVGGGGERRTLRIAADHADAVNVIGGPGVVRHKRTVLDRHCEDVGRDPATIEMTVLDLALVGDDRRMVNDLVEAHRGRSSAAAYRERVGAGTPSELAERYRAFADAGVDRVFVALPNLVGPEDVQRFAPIVTKLRT